EMVIVLDTEGTPLDEVEVTNVRAIERNDRTVLVKVKAPKAYAKRIAGIRVQASSVSQPLPEALERLTDDTIVCRCERVTAGEIRELIRNGYRDMNEIKAVTRAGMGACGGKTCTALIKRLFREEGIPTEEVAEEVKRPLFIEVPLGVFAGTAFAGSASTEATSTKEACAETEEER
ncbi:MAG: (2Fe-2S)-binding protein, partial [Candidatus Bipolaricaulota bacterium]|nr:(2Fe-2S)-binding protein [Candidatus Bipolaricaulota bacterium]